MKTYTQKEVEELCREAFQAGDSYGTNNIMEAEYSSGEQQYEQPINEDQWIKDNLTNT